MLVVLKQHGAFSGYRDRVAEICSQTRAQLLRQHILGAHVSWHPGWNLQNDAQEEKSDELPYDTIFEIFSNRNCHSLMDKPKVIIVQAFRDAPQSVQDNPAVRTSTSPGKSPQKKLKEKSAEVPISKPKVYHTVETIVIPCIFLKKDAHHGSLDNSVNQNVLKLKEEEKKKEEDARIENKTLISRSSFRKTLVGTQTIFQVLCNRYQKATSSEEDELANKILSIFRSTSKAVGHRILNNLEQNMLKLKEEEKRKYYHADLENKVRVLVDFVLEKHMTDQTFIPVLLNMVQKFNRIAALPGPVESTESPNSLKLCSHEESLRLCKEKRKKDGQIYPIKEKKDRTFLALIICNTEFDHHPSRDGADIDTTGMKCLLENLGYTVDVKENLTAEEMETELRKFAARPEHKSSDSTFLVLMSHGILNGICGTKDRKEKPDVLPYDTIFEIFNNRNCCSLKDKPKVIIVQACRGGNYGEVWVTDSPAALPMRSTQTPQDMKNDAVCKTHVEKDFVKFCSSTPHNVSWRDTTRGSLFITELISCFQEYSCCYHLMEIFQMVQQSFEKPGPNAQMPTIERQSLTKYFYLYPGHGK
ncbi:caspase-4-like [Carlito syrichta]|uniref:Caspase-4-like n=1 Tax=Carlito syrichta TaxID=1868482 RepID=A0A1U7UAX2_CARSF|nr:caspase-4-like [Carlito syrichta]